MTSENILQIFTENLHLIRDIKFIYQKATLELKQTILKELFGEKIIVTKNAVEHFFLHPLLQLNYLNIKGLDFIKMGTQQDNSVEIPICTRSGT